MKKLAYLIGFFSLIFIPYFYGIKIVDLFLLITLYILIIYVFLKKITFNKISVIYLCLFMFYFICTIMGAVYNTESYNGIFVGIRYILIFITSLLLLLYNSSMYQYYKKGFVHIAYLTVLWILLDTLYYYYGNIGISINEHLFSTLMIGNDHVLTNRFKIGDLPLLLRASGFGWDPGGIAPALLIAFIIQSYEKGKYKFLLILGILLTLSKTTIIILIFFLIYKFLEQYNQKVSYFFIFSFFIIVFTISLIANEKIRSVYGDGNFRHIKYPSSIIYNLNTSPLEFLFGYGYRGTGEFFYKHVDWMKSQDFMNSIADSKNKVVESSFTNLFLYGGFLGSLIYFSFICIAIFFGTKEERAIVAFIMMSFVGYTFENLWTNMFIYMILFRIIQRRGIKFDKFYNN